MYWVGGHFESCFSFVLTFVRWKNILNWTFRYFSCLRQYQTVFFFKAVLLRWEQRHGSIFPPPYHFWLNGVTYKKWIYLQFQVENFCYCLLQLKKISCFCFWFRFIALRRPQKFKYAKKRKIFETEFSFIYCIQLEFYAKNSLHFHANVAMYGWKPS